MDTATPLVDFAPTARLLGMAALFALLPLTWWWLRQRAADPRARLAALTALTLFLTFDLIVFGAFTRLSDSGLGCPDWPGCYGEATPFAAREDIRAAEAALPAGPVTWGKAWIEMIHRYLAMTVGALILVMTAAAWRWRARLSLAGFSPWWPTLTLFWVIVQGLFGKYTVTLKLYPLIVTLHLLGGLMLLALLAVQHERFRDRLFAVSRATRTLAVVAMATLVLQVASGGWVSTNYAVLACTGAPQCSGQWWPAMDFAHGFTLLRERGGVDGAPLTIEALVAIHMVHRLLAVITAALLLVLAWRLSREAAARGWAVALGALIAWQVASGLSNVILGWPLVAALAHSAGAAGLVLCLTMLLARSRATMPARAASPRRTVAAA